VAWRERVVGGVNDRRGEKEKEERKKERKRKKIDGWVSLGGS
jgi:hypothetical protein